MFNEKTLFYCMFARLVAAALHKVIMFLKLQLVIIVLVFFMLIGKIRISVSKKYIKVLFATIKINALGL